MEVFRHSTHTAYAIRPWKVGRRGLIVIRETGNRLAARDLWNVRNFRFCVWPSRFYRWHWFIRLPFFFFSRDNCGMKIGHPNLYLWVIR
jgi:hypothetical protein